jgi:hypothetical protein
MKTVRISAETWRAVNAARRFPSETFDGAIRRKLKMSGGEPEEPENITASVSDEAHGRLTELWAPDESYDATIGRMFDVTWDAL